MEMNRRTFVATLLAGAFSARSLLAADKHKDEGEWEKLGEKAVSKQEERDVIDVKGSTRYTALSFRVEKGDVEIDDIKVTFDNDKTFSPNTKLVFREGERSSKIDLPGDSRAVRHIRFLYRSLGRKEAVIAVYGKIGEPAKK